MLGSEYNWLISLTRAPGGVPRVSLAQRELLTLAVGLLGWLCVMLTAT